MKYENVDFGAAARSLAQRAGVRLEFEESGRERNPGGIEKDALLRVHERARARDGSGPRPANASPRPRPCE